MTVKELSEKLKEFPEDACVAVGLHYSDEYGRVMYEDAYLEKITIEQPFRYSDGTHCDLNIVFLTDDDDPEY